MSFALIERLTVDDPFVTDFRYCMWCGWAGGHHACTDPDMGWHTDWCVRSTSGVYDPDDPEDAILMFDCGGFVNPHAHLDGCPWLEAKRWMADR